jgi:hypothetical protein
MEAADMDIVTGARSAAGPVRSRNRAADMNCVPSGSISVARVQ